jgi:DNA-binding MarR family transcriptional regulator
MSLCVEYFRARSVNMTRGWVQECAWRANTPHHNEATVKMTPLSGYIGYALRRAQGVIFADFNQTLAKLNLRPGQFAVLVTIDQNPGTSQSSVSAALGIQKANFVATIADLEARGLVRRRKSESDGRTYSLGLTARGRSVLQHAAELQSLHEARLIEQIGTEGRLQLLTLLDRLTRLQIPSPPRQSRRRRTHGETGGGP